MAKDLSADHCLKIKKISSHTRTTMHGFFLVLLNFVLIFKIIGCENIIENSKNESSLKTTRLSEVNKSQDPNFLFSLG